MKLSAILAPLLDAKADHELIRRQILAFEAEQNDALEKRRSTDAERQARKRERDLSRDVTLRHSDRSLTGADVPVEDKTSKLVQEPQAKKENREGAFEAFWSVYPHKVGKADARQKFTVALRKVGVEMLMTALHRYIGKTDDRAWCNPATWLHQERWTDEPATPTARAGPGPRPNPALAAADALMEKFDALTSETGPSPPYPRLVASSGVG